MCFLNQFEKSSLFGQLTPENEMKCDTQETLLWWQQKGEPQFIPPELSPEDRHAEHERSPWIKITLITAPLTMSCQEEGILSMTAWRHEVRTKKNAEKEMQKGKGP